MLSSTNNVRAFGNVGDGWGHAALKRVGPTRPQGQLQHFLPPYIVGGELPYKAPTFGNYKYRAVISTLACRQYR